jgi:hypothetical protein
MVVVVVLAFLAISILTNAQNRSILVELNIEEQKSFQAAEAGVDRAIHDLNMGGTGRLGTTAWQAATDDPNNNRYPDLVGNDLEPNIAPVVYGDVSFFTYAINWMADGIDNDGNGLVDDAAEEDWFTVYSVGFSRYMHYQEGTYSIIEVNVHRDNMDRTFALDAALELQIDKRGNP